jgi:inosine/xanthosine triphosphate pyrophosphatase family protein
MPELGRTLGEMTLSEKTRFSHRAKAFARMQSWLLAYTAGSGP